MENCGGRRMREGEKASAYKANGVSEGFDFPVERRERISVVVLVVQ